MSIDSALSQATRNIPECVATGLVDMTTGMLLGVKTVDSHPQDVLDLVAAATGDLFQGPNVTTIEQMFRKSRGVTDDGRHYFREIVVNSDNLIHVFQRCQRNEEFVFVAVCRVSANLGMVITRSRLELSKIDAEV